MTQPAKSAPKHRAAPTRAVSTEAPRRALRATLLYSTLAVAATGATVVGGVLSSSGSSAAGSGGGIGLASASLGEALDASTDDSGTDDSGTSTTTDAERVEVVEQPQAPARAPEVSRSDRRQAADPAKEAVVSPSAGEAMTRTEDLSAQDPRTVGRALLGEAGFSSDQWGCLDSLWTRESNWTVNADNPTSSAYGIPQALPGSKMSSAGADWATNPVTQIRWGLGYIADRYGSPCGAWAHSESHGWY
ncbi:lytic transglycosylase domain-containing protein [Nocardioides sp. dk4132]|uniref:aggregation-promoting factor C-terminal-like domain-containing protein n=1 Tax=unclassified Nocardioides TaxID=2615069 RepID=UPI00129587DD|nr:MULTISPECIES: lytic transglycosylase domain-containing protein [unclassified Nocardioides]MQW75823.1 lytic transglycosylase domain-containing protein [Nocardioides sp. dk4132]QGA08695.1 lytic transglycosylase domain-containing protein [Nocardioides sp. dk884]